MTIRSTHHTTDLDTDAVIDIRARRRCQLEARGLDPIAVAVNLLAETGQVPGWDYTTYHDDGDGSGWAA
ncbi:hypothetical protein [Nocardia sp. CNY236]|uniref:hypothetical protein n=1 Tax=Nocardia sp. CNY236 TaxID=1169152 RepID=UPI00042A05D5|nr:hypothetical protein [Nocardia sp. CNY236]